MRAVIITLAAALVSQAAFAQGYSAIRGQEREQQSLNRSVDQMLQSMQQGNQQQFDTSTSHIHQDGGIKALPVDRNGRNCPLGSAGC